MAVHFILVEAARFELASLISGSEASTCLSGGLVSLAGARPERSRSVSPLSLSSYPPRARGWNQSAIDAPFTPLTAGEETAAVIRRLAETP